MVELMMEAMALFDSHIDEDDGATVAYDAK